MTDLTTIFTSSPRCKRTNPLETIPQAIEAGIIYNVDYKDLKEAVNGALEAGWKDAVTKLYLSHDDRNERYDWIVTDNLYYGYPQIHTLKSTVKKIAKVEKAFPDCDLLAPAREFCETVAEVVTDMTTLKGMVVKGRKPSTDPRKTPERTIENTGTCACCGRNVKLRKNGKIYDHGYTIQWSMQQGNCFGVDFDPIEVSTEGLVAWLESVTSQRVRFIKNLAALEARPATVNEQVSQGYRKPTKTVTHEQGTPKYERLLESNIRTTAWNIELTERAIAETNKQIFNWEPKALPGTKK